jgi:hypothetical protein
MKAEADIPEGRWDEERRWALRMGLTGADTIEDKSIPTFARGELPHYAGINTFLKAPYAEDVLEVANYDATVLGIPFDGGHHLSPRHTVRAAGRAQDLGALHALQLRDGRRFARADDALRRGRRLHHPGQHREELRPDQPRGEPRVPPARCRS